MPVTTRGIGFHSHRLIVDAEKYLPSVDKPFSTTVHELYRFSLTQLARQLTLAEPGATHSRALAFTDLTRPKVSAFSGHRNGLFLADAINQVGNFTYESIDYTCVVPNERFSYVIETIERPVAYNPVSPDHTMDSGPSAATPKKRPANSTPTHGSLPSPYTLTIFNLRDAVLGLSNPDIPEHTRSEWIQRNPIPGARFNANSLLTNPDEIMPYDFQRYINLQFTSDLNSCDALFNLLCASHPGSIGEVDMNGKGNELNLTAVNTNPKLVFNLNSSVQTVEAESYMFATSRLPAVSCIRGYVNLMNEMPTMPSMPIFSSSYGYRDPGAAVNSFIARCGGR